MYAARAHSASSPGLLYGLASVSPFFFNQVKQLPEAIVGLLAKPAGVDADGGGEHRRRYRLLGREQPREVLMIGVELDLHDLPGVVERQGEKLLELLGLV